VIIGTLATVKDEGKNAYILLTTLFFATICIFPLKELYSPLIASRIWQITFSIEFLCSLIAILLNKDSKYHAIIVALISGVLIICPFYNVLVFSETETPLSVGAESIFIRVDYLVSIITIIVSCIFVICTFVIMKRTKRSASDYKLAQLLQETISLHSRSDSFRYPMEKLWSYEANAKFKQLELLIQHYINEIQTLSKKPPLPNNIYSLSMDELRPMIYNMSADISRLNDLVSKQNSSIEFPSDFSIITELNHSLATPLSQIEANCELLKSKVKGLSLHQLNKIIQYVNFCRCTILAYKELLSSTLTGEAGSYITNLNESFDMYCAKYEKRNLKLNIKNDKDIKISGNVLFSIISPLLENAVCASPDNTEVRLDIKSVEAETKITIENESIQTPKVSDLQTSGFSSKENHYGTGLETVRHFLNLLKGRNLQVDVINNIVKFVLYIPCK
jgi:signal transduction histidine kinase